MSDVKRERILAKLQCILDEGVACGVPGFSAAIRGSDGTRYDLFAGYSDITSKSAIDTQTAFGIGSIIKVFVAVVVLQLIQEKRLSLHDNASALLSPEVLSGIDHAAEADIEHLLSHRTGITSWEDDLKWQKDGRGEFVQPKKIWNKDETLEYVRGSAGFDDGQFHYANTNYTILGLIIERLTKSTAEGEIRRRILQPLGMEATYLEGFERPAEDRTPHRYHWATETFRNGPGISPHFIEVREDLVDVTGTNLSVSWTAGGMVSTPSDLLKFAVGLQNGQLLSNESMETLMHWHTAYDIKDMGCGIFRLKDPALPGTWVGHNGGVLGFTAAWWWSLDESCVACILSNVGASHAGNVPSSAAAIAGKTDFLKLAAELSTA